MEIFRRKLAQNEEEKKKEGNEAFNLHRILGSRRGKHANRPGQVDTHLVSRKEARTSVPVFSSATISYHDFTFYIRVPRQGSTK